MGFIRKQRKEKQVSNEASEMVWIDKGGELILVKKEDLDERGHLIADDINTDDNK